MKRIILFSIMVLLLLPIINASTEQEAAIYTNLVGLGIEEAVVIIQGDDVIIDYVTPEMEYDSDLILQMQGMFVLAAHYVPESIVTIIKVRYDSDYEPIIVAVVPTEFTQMLRKGLIDPETFQGMIEINPQEGSKSNSWLWILVLLVLILIIYKNKDKLKSHLQGKQHTKHKTPHNTQHSSHTKHNPHKVHIPKVEHLNSHNSTHKTSLILKIVALIVNLFIPGVGYFILNQKKKAILILFISLASVVIFQLAYFIIWWYSLIDIGIMIYKKK